MTLHFVLYMTGFPAFTSFIPSGWKPHRAPDKPALNLSDSFIGVHLAVAMCTLGHPQRPVRLVRQDTAAENQACRSDSQAPIPRSATEDLGNLGKLPKLLKLVFFSLKWL